MISAKITRVNRKIVLENIKGKSLREAKLFMSHVTPDGELLPTEKICELKLTLTKSQFALLQRTREVLAAAGSVPTDAEIFSLFTQAEWRLHLGAFDVLEMFLQARGIANKGSINEIGSTR